MDRTERDRFGPTRCGPVDDVIKWSTDRHYILLVVFIVTAAAIYSLGHGLRTFTAVLGQLSLPVFHPPRDGKMSISTL